MEKFMQVVNRAQELGISTFYHYWSEGIKNLVLEDTHKQERELSYLKYAYTEAVMNSRDERVGMQRELAKLTDIEIWEEENLTDEMRGRMTHLREEIAKCKVKESQYIDAREELI